MPLELRPLTANDPRAMYDLLQQIGAPQENGFSNPVGGMPYADFPAWLARNEGYARGIDLEPWMVPQNIYWLMLGSTPVGCGKLRHGLTELMEAEGGHIGYAIGKPHRAKGYGNEILRLLLIECAKMGLPFVQVSAHTDNVASNRIILKNGGALYRRLEGKNLYRIPMTPLRNET